MNVFDYLFEMSKDLDKDFILGNKEEVSYKEIYEKSLKIASYLDENIGRDQNVIITGKNSVMYIIAYLGVLKSGNVCIPLDFSIEKDNFDYIAKLTNCKLVICQNKYIEKLEMNQVEYVLDEDRLSEIFDFQRIVDFDKPFDSSKLAELIFTSGSTGRPKGVMLSHKNLISNTNSILDYLNISSEDIILCVLPFYYCYGLSLLHTHLRVGGSMVLNNEFMFLGTVVRDLKLYKCTGFSGVPSHFQMLLKKSETFKSSNFPYLKYVTQAGGKLHNNFIMEFVQSFRNIDFFVMYGQTEATARLSYLPPQMVLKKIGSVGKNIPGVELKIVDDEGLEVLDTQIGEIVAKGNNIMIGYYKDDDLTKKTLIQNWLHTGDLGMKDENGYIYITARKKEIIKVGGKRISPKEIEEVILMTPEVIDCTIKSYEDDLLGEGIKAEILVNSIQEELIIKDKILKNCKEKLALFKIPRLFEFNANISLKPSGKK